MSAAASAQSVNAIPPGISDPYWAWSKCGGKEDFETRDTYLILYELISPKAESLTFLDKTERTAYATDYRYLNALYQKESAGIGKIQVHPPWWNEGIIFGTATVTATGIDILCALVKLGLLTRFEIAQMPRQVRSRRGFEAPLVSKGTQKIPQCDAEILYGLVDHGCPLFHPGLQLANGDSRFLSVWYQEENTSPKTASAITAPEIWGFGHCLPGTKVTSLKKSGQEDWKQYQALHLKELVQDISHGAHLLGDLLEAQQSPSIAWANRGSSNAPAFVQPSPVSKADTVFVQLPNAYVENLTRSAIGAYRLSAMRYIVESAGQACKKIVIPISSEDYVGSHDGTSLFEQAVDALVAYTEKVKNKTLFVLFAAGNSLRVGAHVAMANISQLMGAPNSPQVQFVGLAAGTTSKVITQYPKLTASDPVNQYHYQTDLRIYPSNELPTFVEIWLAAEINRSLQIRLTNKAAAIDLYWEMPTQSYQVHNNGAGKALIGAVNLAVQKQQLILLRFAPTFCIGDSVATLPAGDWEIQLSTDRGLYPQAYVARSFAGVGGVLRSYQSHFIFPNQNLVSLPASLLNKTPEFGAGSINGMANGQSVRVIGGYRISDLTRANYSSAAPGRFYARLNAGITSYAVDAAAPSDENPYLRGIRHWSNRSAGSYRLAGTSVAVQFAASPLVRGAINLPNKPSFAPTDDRTDPVIPVDLIP